MLPQSSSGQSQHDRRRKSRKRKRVEVRLQPHLSTPEGITLNYLLNNPVLNHREAVMRAVGAYYAPYAYRSEGLLQQEFEVMLRRAIAELEFQKFQLRQDFDFAELPDPGNAMPHIASNSTCKRVDIRLQPALSTPEGITLSYLRNEAFLNYREAVMRAVRAFYMPYAYRLEGLLQQELAAMLRRTIAELEFRKFQLRQDFGFADPSELGYAVPSIVSNSTFQSRANTGVVFTDAPPTQPLPTDAEHALKKFDMSSLEIDV